MAVKKPPATSPARAELSDGPKRGGLVRRATQTMESVAAKGVVGFKGMMDRKKLKLQTVKLRPEPSKRMKWILLLLGLDPSRSIWGLRPFDLKWPGRDSEAWWEQVLAAPRTALEDPLSRVPRGVATGRRPPRRRSTRASPLWSRYALLRGAPRPGPSERPSFPALTFATGAPGSDSPLRQVPQTRLLWGDLQHEIHPCATRLEPEPFPAQRPRPAPLYPYPRPPTHCHPLDIPYSSLQTGVPTISSST